jgi:predicted metal-binding membrane protein
MARTGDQSASIRPPLPPGLDTGLFRASPRVPAILCIVVLAGLGWIYLGLMVGAAASAGHVSGPGMGPMDVFSPGGADAIGRALFEALCRPGFGRPAADAVLASRTIDVALVYLMWSAMIFAMMLPTATPMIVTYADIAQAAAAKREPVVSAVVLIAGYVAAWLAFAAVATALQWGLTRAALLGPSLAPASALFAGAIFIGAGAYQFSSLKHACLTLCQRPFPYLFAHWSTDTAGVFRLGLKQGLYCVGCCWAMMLVMFAVGVMNVVWMAGAGVIMAVEKLSVTTRFGRAVGAVFIAVGTVFIVSSLVGHWPVRAG